ncbi:Hypothetical protein GL50581_3381 [Giardia duodenalis ATCC 50581]|nr:Hypothetical protein GL50581_3381 [Giardia intestinalis ATCC 50581]
MCIDCYFLSQRRATDDTWIPLYSQTCPVPLCAYRIPIISRDHREFLVFRALVLAYAQPPFVQPVYDFFVYGNEFVIICKKPEMTMIDFEVLESGLYQELLHICIYSATMGIYALHKLKIIVGYFTLRHLLVMPENNIVISALNLFQYHCTTCYKQDYDFLVLVDMILRYCLPASSYATYSKKLPPLSKKSSCMLINERRCKTVQFDYDAYALGLEGMKNEFSSEILFLFIINILQTRHWPAISTSPYIAMFSIFPDRDTVHKQFRVCECSNTKSLQVYKAIAKLEGFGSSDQLNVYFGNETSSPAAHTSVRDTLPPQSVEDIESDTEYKESSKTDTTTQSNTVVVDDEGKTFAKLDDASLTDIPRTGQQEALTTLQSNNVNTRLDAAEVNPSKPASYINEMIQRILNKLERMQIFDPESLLNALHTISAQNILKLEKIGSVLKESKENIEQMATVLPTPALLSIDRPTTFMSIKINQGPEIELGYGVVTQLIKGKARQISKSTSLSENEVIRAITFISDNSLALQSGKERLVSVPEEMLVIHTGFHICIENGHMVRKKDTLRHYIENVAYTIPEAETRLEKIICTKEKHKRQRNDTTRMGTSMTMQSDRSEVGVAESAYDLFYESFTTKKKIQAIYEPTEKLVLTLQKNARAMTEEQKVELIMLLRLFGINLQMHFYLRRGVGFPHNAIPVVIPFNFEDLTVHPAVSNVAYIIGRIGFERWITFLESFQTCIRDGTLMPAISLYWSFFYFSLFSLTNNVITAINLMKFRELILFDGIMDEPPADLLKKKEDMFRKRMDAIPASSSAIYPQSTVAANQKSHIFNESMTKEMRYNGIDPLLYSENIFITHFILPQTEISFDRCVNLLSKTVSIFFMYVHQNPEMVSALSNLNGNLGESILFRSNDQDVLKCLRALMRHLSTYAFEVVQPSLKSTDSFDVEKPFDMGVLQTALPSSTTMTVHCQTPAMISVLSAFISFVDASICIVNATARLKNLRIPSMKFPHVFNFRSVLDPTYLNTAEEAYSQASVYMVCLGINMLLLNTAPQPNTLEYGILLLSFTAIRNILSPEAMLFLATKMANPISFYNYVPLYTDFVEHQTLINAYQAAIFANDEANGETDYTQTAYGGVDIKREYKQRMITLFMQLQKPYCNCYPSIELCSNCAAENEFLRLECQNSISFFSDDFSFTFIVRLFYEAYLSLYKRLIPFLITTKDRDVLYVMRIIMTESRINPTRFISLLDSASELPRTDDGEITGKDTGLLFGLSGILNHITSNSVDTPIEVEVKKYYHTHTQHNTASPRKDTSIALHGRSIIGNKVPVIPGVRPAGTGALSQAKGADHADEQVNLDTVSQNDTYLTILVRCLLRYYTNINLFQPTVVNALISLITPETYDRLQQTKIFHPEILIYVTFSIMLRASKQSLAEKENNEIDKGDFGLLTIKSKKDANRGNDHSDDSVNFVVGVKDEDEDVESDLVDTILCLDIKEEANSLTIVSTCIQLLNALLGIYLVLLKNKVSLLADSQGYKLNQQKDLFSTKPPSEILDTLFDRVLSPNALCSTFPGHMLESIEILAGVRPFSIYNAAWGTIPLSRNNTGTIDYLLRFLELLMGLYQTEYDALSLVNTIQCEHFNITKFAIDDLESRKLFRRHQYQTQSNQSQLMTASQSLTATEDFLANSQNITTINKAKIRDQDKRDSSSTRSFSKPLESSMTSQMSVDKIFTEIASDTNANNITKNCLTFGETETVSDSIESLSQTTKESTSQLASVTLLNKEFHSLANLRGDRMIDAYEPEAANVLIHEDVTPATLPRTFKSDTALQLVDSTAPPLSLSNAQLNLRLDQLGKDINMSKDVLLSQVMPLAVFLERGLIIILHATSTTAHYAFGVDGILSLVALLRHIRIPQFMKLLYRILDSKYVKFVWRLRGIDFATQMFVWTLTALRECCRPTMKITRGDLIIQTPRDIPYPSFLQIKDSVIYGSIELKSEAREISLMMLAEMSLCKDFWKEVNNVNFLQIVDRICGNCLYFYDYFNEKLTAQKEEISVLSDEEFSRGLKLSELTDISTLLWNSLQRGSINPEMVPLLRVYKQMLAHRDNVNTDYGDNISRIIIRSLYPLKLLCKNYGYKIITELGNLLGECLIIDSSELRILIIEVLYAGIAGIYLKTKGHLRTRLDLELEEDAQEMSLPEETPTDSMSLYLSKITSTAQKDLSRMISGDYTHNLPDIFTGTESMMFDMGANNQSAPSATPIGSSLAMSGTVGMSISLMGSINPAASSFGRPGMIRGPQLNATMRSTATVQDRPRMSRGPGMGGGVPLAPTPSAPSIAELAMASPSDSLTKSLPLAGSHEAIEGTPKQDQLLPQPPVPSLPPVIPPKKEKDRGRSKGKKDQKANHEQKTVESIEEDVMQDAHRGLIMTEDLSQMITAIEQSFNGFLANFAHIMRLSDTAAIATTCNILNFMYMLHLDIMMFTKYNLPVLLIECMRTKPLEIKKIIIDLLRRLFLNNEVRKVFADINSVKYLRQAINMHSDVEFRNSVTDVITMIKGKTESNKKDD